MSWSSQAAAADAGHAAERITGAVGKRPARLSAGVGGVTTTFQGQRVMGELQAFARLKIHQGKLEEFKRIAAKCMESVRTRDTGTLQYDWFFSSDYSECLVYERYRDSQALLEHVANLGETMAARFRTCSGAGEICGTPSPELMKALERSRVRIYSPYQSI